jgi:large conductance mechanosensitive channel
MAVGVIVGGAFTGIVNGLSNFILKPIINWLLALILGSDGLEGAVTILSPAYNAEGAIDLANSIYIDWGAFISAIINFFIIALALFSIVKIINKIREENNELKANLKKNIISKEDKKALKAKGIKLRDKEAVKAYFAEKKAEEERLAEIAKKEAEEKARKERLENPTTEDLLKDIRAILRRETKKNAPKKKNNNKKQVKKEESKKEEK